MYIFNLLNTAILFDSDIPWALTAAALDVISKNKAHRQRHDKLSKNRNIEHPQFNHANQVSLVSWLFKKEASHDGSFHLLT